jgi:hypothetical protein
MPLSRPWANPIIAFLAEAEKKEARKGKGSSKRYYNVRREAVMVSPRRPGN